MSRHKPWETTGPPSPQSKREKGRDQLFKEKITGVPEKDKLPKPGGITADDTRSVDWKKVLQPLPGSIYKLQEEFYITRKAFGTATNAWKGAIEKLRETNSLREQVVAERGVIEDQALAKHNPVIGQEGRETTEKR